MSKKKNEPSPQAITGWKKKADHLVGLRKELVDAEDELEARLEPIRQQYEPDIEKLRKEVRSLEKEITTFGEEHFATLTVDGSEIRTKTSILTLKSMPGRVTVEDGFSEPEVVDALWKDAKTRKYVTVKKSLDRTGIKKALANAGEAIREVLGIAGVVQVPGVSVTVKGKGD